MIDGITSGLIITAACMLLVGIWQEQIWDREVWPKTFLTLCVLIGVMQSLKFLMP